MMSVRPLVIAVALATIMCGVADAKYSANPNEACRFLSQHMRVQTGFYKAYPPDTYQCGTDYEKFGPVSKVGLTNNIAYYVTGSKDKAKRLKLILNVNNKGTAKEAHTVLWKYAKALYQKAFGKPMPQQIEQAIGGGRAGSWKEGFAVITLTHNDWPTGLGYDLEFMIE